MNTLRNTLRIAACAALVMLAAGCSTTPSGTSASAPPATPAKAAAPAAAGVTGAWALSIETPMGTRPSDAQFTQNGEQLTGKMISERGEVPFTGTVKGNAIAFSFNVDAQGQQLKLDYTGTVTGDTIAGTVKFGDFGDGKWTAKRK
jgi:hypothetical protein